MATMGASVALQGHNTLQLHVGTGPIALNQPSSNFNGQLPARMPLQFAIRNSPRTANGERHYRSRNLVKRDIARPLYEENDGQSCTSIMCDGAT